jgi:signal transduction histidine kinase
MAFPMDIRIRHILLLVLSILGLWAANYYAGSESYRDIALNRVNSDLGLRLSHFQWSIAAGLDPILVGRELKAKQTPYFVWTRDSLLYWNENRLDFQLESTNEFVHHGDGIFFRSTRSRQDTFHTAFIPLPQVLTDRPAFPSHFIHLFSPDRKVQTKAWLATNLSPPFDWLYLIFYLATIYFGIRVSLDGSAALRQRHQPILALLCFTVIVFGVRLASLSLDTQGILNSFLLFGGHERPSLLSPTLGDLLINIMILCILVWYVRRFVKPHYFHIGPQMSIAVLNYCLVYISSLLMVQVYRQLVLFSGISFDFEYVFFLDTKSFLAILGILILAIALFLLDLHILRIIRHLGISGKKRLGSNCLALGLAIAIGWLLPYEFSWPIYLGLASYITLLDLSIDYYRPSGSWYLIWTWTGSILVSSILFQFHIERDVQQRQLIATELEQSFVPGNGLRQEQEAQLKKKLSERQAQSDYLAVYDIVPGPGPSQPGQSVSSHLPIGNSGFSLAKKSNAVFKYFSFFSFIFLLFHVLLILFHLLNKKYRWLAISVYNFLPAPQTLRYRIQASIFWLSIGSFLIIVSVVTYYISQNANQWNAAYQPDLSAPIQALLSDGKLSIYDLEGIKLPDHRERADYTAWQGRESISSSFRKISRADTYYYVQSKADFIAGQAKRKLNDFLGTLLNVFVFLLVGMIIVSLVVSNSIVKPLSLLGSKLKQIQVGGSNQRLEWNNSDELGSLIRNYNEMIQELDRSTRMLALTERETAWREMAKQVAHEIKNPLTPMKLISQHLQNTVERARPEELPALVKRVTQTLIEQIENLSKIASEFSNFAKLPAPENEKIVLNEVVTSTHDLFRKREDMDIHLRVPIDEIYVFADKNHIIRVLTNLIKNAIQAIPLGRRGRIEIWLYKQQEKAIIKVADNGCGIPDSMKDKVFYPNFTTKNSGTGLGLAIVRDIIDSSHGRIYFNTQENKGTEFYVELPLMHMEDNFRVEHRVSL